MAENIQPGIIAQLKANSKEAAGIALQVVEYEALPNDKYKVKLTDGKDIVAGLLTSQVGKLVKSGELQKHGILRVSESTNQMTDGGLRLMITAAEVLGNHEGLVGGTVEAVAIKKDHGSAAAVKDEPMQDVQPPAASSPAPTKRDDSAEAKTPAAALKTEPKASPYNPYTPATHPTPPSVGWNKISSASASKRACQPIAAINPYNNNWTVKAKLVSKGQKRSFSKGSQSQSVFTAEFVDEQGTSIEGTFWREAADKYYDSMEEGKVYLLSKGSVKPANKKYSAVRNDYTLHFDNQGLVEECTDSVDTSKMQAKMEFVPIDRLAAYIDKKMTVDVIGVVTQAQPLGSVKRKTDQVELSRRDVTIVDQSLKTVVVTLWGQAAEDTGAEIEARAAENPVLAVSSCRVSGYNGVSLSGLQRSSVLLNPDVPEAESLREWYESSGRGQATQHVGEGLDSALKRPAGGAAQRSTLQSIKDNSPASAEEKPTYSTVIAAFATIDDKQMDYLACPENNRKVVEQDGQYYCEYDGKTYPSATRRYVTRARVADESGELYVNVFNEQGEVLLKYSADELAPIREGEPNRFAAIIRERKWQEFVLRIKAQAQEYNGETRVRYALADIKPLNYAVESKRLLDLIAGRAA